MSARRVFLAIFVAAVTISALGFAVVGGAQAHPMASSPLSGSASSPSTTTPSTAPATSVGNPAGHAQVQQILSRAASQHIPLEAVSLPNLLEKSYLKNDVVTPGYSVAPAPMGIGTYGVMNTTGTPVAYSMTTSSWEGSITLNSVNTFLLDNDGAISTNGSQNTFGVQLNAVTTDSTVGQNHSMSFWTQNVLYFNFPYPGTITFLDNVWNFSSPAVALTAGTLYSYNGTPVYPQYYYDFGPTFTYTFPLTVQLYLNTSTTNLASTGFGYTTVRFGYNVLNGAGQSEAHGVYDTVLFSSTTPIGSVPASPYLVDGSKVTPTGFIPWDAEIMIGGPGGGTTTSVYGISGSETLEYLNSTTGSDALPMDAWNIGSETGETSEGIAESYTAPGTVELSTGPSIVMPFWNATPGGNVGQVTYATTISPTNAFIFFTPGSSYNASYASWAPTQTAGTYDYVLPPGMYTVDAMLSDYAPMETIVNATSGTVPLDFALSADMSAGVYTPLFAWNNAQFASISYFGSGTLSNPYLIVNNPAPGGLNPVFGMLNDYLYQVFPGVLFADTTAYTDMINPSLLNVTYPAGYDAALTYFGVPFTNNLQFELFNTSHVSIIGADGISGWFLFLDYGPTGFLPLANVVIWDGSQNLVASSLFLSQGSSLLLAGSDPSLPTGNYVWGNTFLNSTQLTPTMYPGDGATNGPPVALWGWESGDWIYNNWVATSITAFAPNYNMFYGVPQVNAENWNLPTTEPASTVTMVNGVPLSGSIVDAGWQGGNFWGDVLLTPIPYDEYGLIATGGDYYPYPPLAIVFTVVGLTSGTTWSVTLASLSTTMTATTSSTVIIFFVVPSSYSFTATVSSGTISPSSGTVNVTNHSLLEIMSIT